MRDNNRECARIFDGLRGVWNKWKKQYFIQQNITHHEWIATVLETSREIFEREIRSDYAKHSNVDDPDTDLGTVSESQTWASFNKPTNFIIPPS